MGVICHIREVLDWKLKSRVTIVFRKRLENWNTDRIEQDISLDFDLRKAITI